jgi:N-acylneuraminate cytidylyltransferase
MEVAGCFDSVWVSTDSDAIAQRAASVGARVFRRSEAFAQDTSSSVDAVREFLLARPEVRVVGLVQCTSPFILPEFLERAAASMRSGATDSVFSVTREKKFRWSETDTDSRVTRPVDFDPASRPRRQDWRGYLVENGMFYFFRRELVMESGLLQGGSVAYVEVPSEHSLDIDTKMDLIIADIIARSNLLPSNAIP